MNPYLKLVLFIIQAKKKIKIKSHHHQVIQAPAKINK